MRIRIPERAIRPMFDDFVAIEATRPDGVLRGTFAACVFRGLPEALSDGVTDTTVETATVLVAKYGPNAWNHVDPPRIGDTVTINGVKFAVTSRDDLVSDHYHLEVRQS